MRNYKPAAANTTLLEAQELSFAYAGGQPLFKGLNMSLKHGETVALTGPSGCGKSTLCYILAHVIPRNIAGELSGSVLLEGVEISSLPLAELAQAVGMVRQEPESQLFAPTVEDELAFGPENLCLPPALIRERVEEALALTGLATYREAAPHILSGGQKQLVALAAVLTLRPRLLILDEIFCHLDEEAVAKVEALLRQLNARGVTVLLTEHETQRFALAHRLLRLEAGVLREVLS